MDLIQCNDPLNIELEQLYMLHWPFNLCFQTLMKNEKVILWVDNIKIPKVAVLFFRGSFHVLGSNKCFDCGKSLSKLVLNLDDNSSLNYELRVSSLPKNLIPRKITGFSLVKEVDCGLFYLHPDNFFPVDTQMDIEPLDLKDAREVVKNTAYEIDVEYVRRCIASAPSVSVKKGKDLLCYMLVHLNGSIGMLFTKENHRKKGLASSVISCLTQKQIKKRTPVFCYIVNGNNDSRKIFERLGFERLGSVSWLKYERC